MFFLSYMLPIVFHCDNKHDAYKRLPEQGGVVFLVGFEGKTIHTNEDLTG